MVNSRTKGNNAERAVARYFAQFPPWPKARRSVAAGWSNRATEHQDEGDIAGTDPFCLQVKNTERAMVGQFLADTWADTCKQALEGLRLGIIIEKRAGYADVGQWWLHTSCSIYIELITGRRPWVADQHMVRVLVGDLIQHMVIHANTRH